MRGTECRDREDTVTWALSRLIDELNSPVSEV